MEFSVLGPLNLRAGNLTITPTAAKPRQVLALLLMNANHVVSVAGLIRELWEENPPRSALTTLQTYILQLRKLFAAGTGLPPERVNTELLVTRIGGYVLNAEPGALDASRFDQLARTGREALARGEDSLAARKLREALSLWRGQALVDVVAGPLLAVHAVRLEEARLATLEYRIEADLRLGMHHELLAELAYLAVQQPLHENLHAQLMIALYRCGRRVDALEVYRRMRQRLVEELGLEPSLTMRRVQEAILVGDAALDIARSATLLPDRLSYAAS